MKNWEPTVEQRKYLDLILSMTTDCIMCKGVDTVKAYTNNLAFAIAGLDTTKKEPCPACGKALQLPEEYLGAMLKMRKEVEAYRDVILKDYEIDRTDGWVDDVRKLLLLIKQSRVGTIGGTKVYTPQIDKQFVDKLYEQLPVPPKEKP